MADLAWVATVDDVGAIIRSRTTSASGEETGTFTGETRPTTDQAEGIIESIAGEIAAEVGSVPAELEDLAGSVNALGAAAQIELTYYPEQQDNGPYDRLNARFEKALARLRAGVASAGTAPGESVAPTFRFPTAVARDVTRF